MHGIAQISSVHACCTSWPAGIISHCFMTALQGSQILQHV